MPDMTRSASKRLLYMTMRRRVRAGATALLLVGLAGADASVALAQSGTPPTGTPAAAPYVPPSRRIVPGDTALRPSGIHVDTLTYTLTGYRDGDEIPVGTIVDMTTREGDASPMIRRVLTVKRGTALLIDSTVTDAKTLAPRQHRSVQPQRILRIDIVGVRVRGTIGPVDAPGVAIDTTLSFPIFDSGNWDLIVRAMPLAPDFATIFRVYDLENGMHDYVVRVIGSTTMYGEPAHVVLFRLGAGSEATVWIGANTRRLLQVETPVGPTTLLRQSLRVTDARSPQLL